jgi:gluconolactonase
MLERFEVLAEGLNHPEGVAWSPFDDRVYAGGEGGEIYRISLDGEVELLASSGGSMLGVAVEGAA